MKQLSITQILIFSAVGLLTTFAQLSRAVAGPTNFSYEGRVYDSGGNPAVGNATFTLRILNPAGNCVLYEENSSSTDLSASLGYFSVSVGTGTPTSAFTSVSLASVFSNRAAITGGGSCTYTPVMSDGRLLQVVVNVGGAATTMTPSVAIGANPFAMVADDANTLGGLPASSFVQTNSTGLSQSNVTNIFSATNYPLLTSLLAGTNSSYVTASAGGAKIPSVSTAPGSPTTGQIWFNSSVNAYQYFNGTSVQQLGVSGSGLSSLTVGTNLTANGTAGGTLNSSGTIDLANSGVSAGTYAKTTINSKGLVTYGTGLSQADIPQLTTANKVTGEAITTGTIGGSTAFNSTGNIATTGNVSGANLTSNSTTARQLRMFDPAANSTNFISISAPTLSSSYSLNLPATAGIAGYALTTDGSGNLSWAASSSGAVSGAASLASGKIWVGNSSGIAAAVIPSGDFTIATTGAATVTGLRGYSVAATAPTAIGQILRWNGSAWAPNSVAMSDLRSTITGTSALSSCSTTQTLVFNSVTDSLLCSNIAIASNQVTWASTGANLIFAGPSSGGAGIPTFRSLTSADLPAGLSSQWTTNGSSINYSSGSVGIGTVVPQATLDVYGSGAILVPRSTIAQRPVGVNGMIRYQNDNQVLEAYVNGAWSPVATGAGGASQWTTSGPNIFFAGTGGGRVGIGTSNPMTALDTGGGDITTGRIFAVNGNSAFPQYSFNVAGNGNSMGMFYAATNVLGFSTNGTERLRIDSSGNFGIGTASPAAILDVVGVGQQSAIIVPRDTIANRPTTPVNGMIRYNSTNGSLETYGGSWNNVVVGSGAVPTVSTCGGGTLSTGANALRGVVTFTSSTSSCTLAFNQTFTTPPICVVQWVVNSGLAISQQTTTTGLVVTMSNPATSGAFSYICLP